MYRSYGEAGAVVVDPITEHIIYQQFLEEDVVKAIAEHLARKSTDATSTSIRATT